MKNKQGTAKALGLGTLGLILSVVIMVGLVFGIYTIFLKPADFGQLVPATGDGTGYYRHNYEELNDNEKLIYSVILKEIYSQPESIEIPTMQPGDDLSRIFQAISHDNPDLFGLSLNCSVYTRGYKTYFKPQYDITYDEYAKRLSEVQGVVSSIVTNAKSYKTLYEQEKFVHDYIINHCSYEAPTNDPSVNTIYGCLVLGKASCEGYSRSFQYIMSQLGVDNRLVTGESADDGVNYVGHMWNYVILDGEGYFVDLTWDDPRSEGAVLRHTYFNVTTSDISAKHRNIEQKLPLCTATAYNYYIHEAAYLNVGSGDLFETKISTAVHYAVQQGRNCFELRFSDAAVMEQAKNTLFNSGVIYAAYTEAGIVDATGSAKVYYSADEQMHTICFYL